MVFFLHLIAQHSNLARFFLLATFCVSCLLLLSVGGCEDLQAVETVCNAGLYSNDFASGGLVMLHLTVNAGNCVLRSKICWIFTQF